MKTCRTFVFFGAMLLSAPLIAEEYTLSDTKPTIQGGIETEKPVYYPHYDNGLLMIDQCEMVEQKEKCHPVNAPDKALKTALDNVVSSYTELLADHVKLKKLIQIQADNALKGELLIDPETDKKYVMVAIGSNFYFPLESSAAEKGDYDILSGALQYELDRFKKAQTAIDWLSSEDVKAASSKDVTEKQYEELSALYYTIRYAKLLSSPMQGKVPKS